MFYFFRIKKPDQRPAFSLLFVAFFWLAFVGLFITAFF
jgi:hypothetical protein